MFVLHFVNLLLIYHWSVVDVYQAWCGLCSGMTSNFRKYRNDINDDLLQFFAVSWGTTVLPHPVVMWMGMFCGEVDPVVFLWSSLFEQKKHIAHIWNIVKQLLSIQLWHNENIQLQSGVYDYYLNTLYVQCMQRLLSDACLTRMWNSNKIRLKFTLSV